MKPADKHPDVVSVDLDATEAQRRFHTWATQFETRILYGDGTGNIGGLFETLDGDITVFTDSDVAATLGIEIARDGEG